MPIIEWGCWLLALLEGKGRRERANYSDIGDEERRRGGPFDWRNAGERR